MGALWSRPSAADRLPGMSGSIAREIALPAAFAMPDVTVRVPNRFDVPGLAALFSEMQRHYECPVADEQAVAAARLACAPVTAAFDPRVLIAAVDGVIVGSIVMNVTFPASELSRSLYIRDLYVARSMRRHGVGQALVRTAARWTYAQGFSALDWTTETGNSTARRMYESCGARMLQRTYYRLAQDDMSDAMTTPQRVMG
jgi:GNAT superfamily N-acetyltransferase